MGFSPAYATEYTLSSEEGALVSVAIRVEPRRLEALLEALAQVAFPINPQIYHEAEIEVIDPHNRAATEITTLVEFPAYLARVEDVFRILQLYGFDRRDVLVTGMLRELRGPELPGNAPPDSEWRVRSRQHSAAAH
ncbi:MAG TPA: hypothetical protein VKV17_17035 [Bryobacteraceae bacterium]|nr:hypothetical protein [Bryobacteraceae bacterium]